VSARCCRSAPRCGDCPVRLKAAARGPGAAARGAVLVAEVLGGSGPRPLPPQVAAALAELDAARRAGTRRVAAPVAACG
jgi:hypothetical protein